MKLVIFDFDGTLVDSRKLNIESHRIIFNEYGFSPPTDEKSLCLIGMSLELVLLQSAGPDAPVEKMAAAYQCLLPQLRADVCFRGSSVRRGGRPARRAGRAERSASGNRHRARLACRRTRSRTFRLAKVLLHNPDRG